MTRGLLLEVRRETKDLIHEGIATFGRVRASGRCYSGETKDLIHEGIATPASRVRNDGLPALETKDLIHEGIATVQTPA